MSEDTVKDDRPDTATLKMKIRPAMLTEEELDPVEPSRPRIELPSGRAMEKEAHDSVVAAPPLQAPEEPVIPQLPVEASQPIARAIASSTVRGYNRSQGSVTFTNRLSPAHRDLLQDLVNVEGSTIRGILESAIDLYAAERHPELSQPV